MPSTDPLSSIMLYYIWLLILRCCQQDFEVYKGFFFLGKASDNELCPWQFLFTDLIYSGQTFLGKVLSSIMGKIMRGRA